jgi:hypothetical protein
MAAKEPKKNVPAEWSRSWQKSDDPLDMYGSATYPRDGRETIFDPFEAFACTSTVGDFLIAYQRAERGDPTLPDGFQHYLRQRTSNPERIFFVCEPDDRIDRFGDVVKRRREDH